MLEVLAGRGIVLSDYRPASLGRRVATRMAALEMPDASRYIDRLRCDPTEPERLVDFLLVQVTSFFRDPPVFTALQERVLPELLRRAGSQNRQLRAWVVGAATGQEAYSLAMILTDLGAATGIPFEVLATDRSESALARARRGVYTDEEAASLPAQHRRWIAPTEPSGFLVQDRIRERVRFHPHDLLGPRLAPREAVLPVFDVVLCRNVLIYLEPRSQALAVERFSQVVLPGGALVLGQAESVPAACRGFVPFPGVDPGSRIYLRAGRPAGWAAEDPR